MWNILRAQWGETARDGEGERERCEEAIQMLSLMAWHGILDRLANMKQIAVQNDSVKCVAYNGWLFEPLAVLRNHWKYCM